MLTADSARKGIVRFAKKKSTQTQKAVPILKKGSQCIKSFGKPSTWCDRDNQTELSLSHHGNYMLY